MFSCNPVKKVMQDQKKFDIVAEEVIRRGYCKADTVTEYRDSIVYKDSIIERIEKIPCADFDTTIGRARIRVSSGVLTYSSKDSIVYKTTTKTIRDLAMEEVLRGDISDREAEIRSLKDQVLNSQIEKKQLKKDANFWRWRFWGALGLIVLLMLAKQGIKVLLNRF
jgi:hypothetical protein